MLCFWETAKKHVFLCYENVEKLKVTALLWLLQSIDTGDFFSNCYIKVSLPYQQLCTFLKTSLYCKKNPCVSCYYRNRNIWEWALLWIRNSTLIYCIFYFFFLQSGQVFSTHLVKKQHFFRCVIKVLWLDCSSCLCFVFSDVLLVHFCKSPVVCPRSLHCPCWNGMETSYQEWEQPPHYNTIKLRLYRIAEQP